MSKLIGIFTIMVFALAIQTARGVPPLVAGDVPTAEKNHWEV